MMLAAKLEQFEIPCFDVMHHFLNKSHGVGVTLGDFVKLEIKVLKALEFDLNYVSPLPFLERFLRIFRLDLEENEEQSRQIVKQARLFCVTALRNA